MYKILIYCPILISCLQAAVFSQTTTINTELQVRDDFDVDSRSDYSVHGKVGWSAGALILEKGSKIERALPGSLDTAEVELKFGFGSTPDAAQPSEIVIEFGGFVSWAIRIRQETKEQMPLLEIYANPRVQSSRVMRGQVFYRSEIASLTNGIRISCAKGQVSVSAGGEVIASRLFSSDFYTSRLRSIVIHSSAGTTELQYLFVSIPTPLSPDQERELQAAYMDFLPAIGSRDKKVAQSAHSKVVAIVGEYHPWSAWMLETMGTMFMMEDRTKALELKATALKIKNELYGELHPDSVRSLQELAALTGFTGNLDQSFKLGKRASQLARRAWETQSYFLSDRESFDFRALVSVNLSTYVYSACSFLRVGRIQDPTLPTEIYEEWLNWKGAIQSRQRLVRLLREDSRVSELLDELSHSSALLSKLSNNHLLGDDVRDILAKQQLENQRFDQIQWQIAQASKSHNFLDRDVTVAELAAALPRDAVLVDFMTSFDTVIAFVTSPDASVRIVQFGKAAPIGQAIEAWRQEINEKSVGFSAGTRVRELIWDALRPYVPAGSLILISADGAIARLPFSAIPLDSNPVTYLVEMHRIAFLPVPRELVVRARSVTQPTDRVSNGSVLLAGGIDFDGAETEVQKSGAQSRPALKPLDSATKPIRRFIPLPGSKDEVDAIENILRGIDGSTAVVKLTGRQATESNFRLQAEKARIVHVASHGYFSTKQAASLATPIPNVGAHVDFAKQGTVAELANGIVLAGANARTDGTDELSDDGILTSLEVQGMSLGECDLVVLSACETGLGVEAAGEGLLGLQRSFQIAGVGSTIASSWRVDDEITQWLMTEFYKGWLTGNMSKADALREAQLRLLNEVNYEGNAIARGTIETLFKNKPAAEAEAGNIIEGRRLPPRFWAAFSLSGDWR